MTSFEKRVYQVVRKIPRGKVRAYKEVARIIGHPRAYRAVGNALNKAPGTYPARHSTVLGGVPCHRVIKSDGSIGGYAGGTKKKITLLKEEGVEIKNSNVVFKY